MRLILLRHGQTLFNELDYNQGWFDAPLTKLGIEQANIARINLADLKIDYCYSSPSERAVDTAEIALNNRNIKIVRDKRLKEMNFGHFEGWPNPMVRAITRGVPELEDSYKNFGGESNQEVIDRHLEAIKEYESKHENDTLLIGGHGWSLMQLLYALSDQSIYDIIPDFKWMQNADCILLEGYNLKYKVVEYYSVTSK